MAWVVRALVFLAPLVTGWVSVRVLSASFLRPDGWVGLVCWGLQAVAVASITAMVVDRLAQRALPLATLMGMSMTFPDQAPSRFSVAMRAGTVRKLQTRLESLERHGLGDDPQQAAERAIELVTVLGRHDRLTRGHTERVRAYADLIAVELGLDEHDRQMLAWGVTLHDIGKLTVPPEILNKDGRPTDEEWAVLSAHPAEGARLLEPLADWLGHWVKAAGEHHERWDGNGYPKGLTGTQISLAGRITAVADAYDVITSHRSYKTPLSTGAARKELVDCAGTQFDPAIVRALLKASLRPPRGVAGVVSWLPELPGLVTVTQSIGAAPAAVATIAVAATAPLVGLAPAEPPPGLADVSNPPVVSVDERDDDPSGTTAMTVAGEEGDLLVASIPTADQQVTGSTAGVDSTLPTTTATPSSDGADEPPTSVTPGSIPATVTSPSTTAATGPATSATTTTPTTTTTPATITAPPTTASATTTPTTTTGLPGPTAQDDVGTQREGKQKQYDVLGNDTPDDAPIDPATLTVVTPPAHGTAQVWASNKIRYDAADGHTGTVVIVYEICDTANRCSRATLTVTLTP